jgi:hypothetical protein
VGGRRERRHVDTRLSQDRLRGAAGDTRHGLRRRGGLGKRHHGFVDPSIQRGDMGVQRLDEGQMLLEQKGVVRSEAAHEGLAERRALFPE